jgi:hypothetical protein
MAPPISRRTHRRLRQGLCEQSPNTRLPWPGRHMECRAIAKSDMYRLARNSGTEKQQKLRRTQEGWRRTHQAQTRRGGAFPGDLGMENSSMLPIGLAAFFTLKNDFNGVLAVVPYLTIRKDTTMKLSTIVAATAFALSSAAALAQPGPYWRGTTTAPSVGSYTWPSVGTTNAVPTWRNTNPGASSRTR